MATPEIGNFAVTRLVTAPSGTSGLSFTVTATEGAKFAGLADGVKYFYGVISNPAQTIFEVVKIANISGDSFTIANSGRGLDGTTAQTWNTGDLFYYPMTKIMINELLAQILTDAKNFAWSTGDVKLTMKTVADAGWVLCNDGTIGSAASGATTRANADTEALFTLLWNNVSNTHAPVSGGRGANAAADFAAHKTIALTKMLGRSLAISGAGSGLTARALGQTVGAETHTLSQAETPLKPHAHTTNPHSHGHGGQDGQTIVSGGQPIINASPGAQSTDAATVTVNSTGDATASAHNIMDPTSYLNAMIKL